MSPHQSFPLCHKVPDKAQDWSKLRTNCYAMHANAMYRSYAGVNTPSTASKSLHVSRYGTAKYYATVPSSCSSRLHWSSEQLHGSPPTYRLGLPSDKNTEYSSLLNLPTGRDDTPDKELTYNFMNGSPSVPPGTVGQQSKHKENRPFHNLSRGRSVWQVNQMGDSHERYKTILPAGRDDPPDKKITYNCMNGSPGDPPGTVMHQSKQQKSRSFHNPSRGRSIRQGGRMGDNYRRYKTCH
jgi:hypothetical protein